MGILESDHQYDCALQHKCTNWHCVIHNQGTYDPTGKVKEDLLNALKIAYPNITSYIIAQEENTNPRNGDTHLQFNIYFKNKISKRSILDTLQSTYKSHRDAEGRLVGRVQVLPIHKTSNKMDNYLQSKTKDGADPAPLSDLFNRAVFQFDSWLDKELQKEINNNLRLLNKNNILEYLIPANGLYQTNDS